MSTDTVITAESLTRTFDTFTAVNHIDFTVNHGEIFGLLGPNGAGKTTTIKMLTSILPITSGSATVAGVDVNAHPMHVRQNIGYVSQMLSTDGLLTGRENLLLTAKLYGIPRSELNERVNTALTFMGLNDAADRLAKTYSGGMVRRLEIAQAMLHRPAILFLDEPTIGLDPMARYLVWERLKKLQSELGMSVLITTHDMEEADHLCNRLAIMHKGEIAAIGTPEELKGKVGQGATLNDVFIHYSGTSIDEGGRYQDVKQTRKTAKRLN